MINIVIVFLWDVFILKYDGKHDGRQHIAGGQGDTDLGAGVGFLLSVVVKMALCGYFVYCFISALI